MSKYEALFKNRDRNRNTCMNTLIQKKPKLLRREYDNANKFNNHFDPNHMSQIYKKDSSIIGPKKVMHRRNPGPKFNLKIKNPRMLEPNRILNQSLLSQKNAGHSRASSQMDWI